MLQTFKLFQPRVGQQGKTWEYGGWYGPWVDSPVGAAEK